MDKLSGLRAFVKVVEHGSFSEAARSLRLSRSAVSKYVIELEQELGVQLLKAMRRKRVILDLSHMADQAVADAFAMWRGPIMASHSNARAIVPGDRQITDATAREVARRGGVIGVSFYQKHLRSSGRATLDDVVKQVLHHARASGGPEHVGLGTDLDGGFDAKQAPINDLAELKELPARLRRSFSKAQVQGVMGDNWLAFLARALPG